MAPRPVFKPTSVAPAPLPTYSQQLPQSKPRTAMIRHKRAPSTHKFTDGVYHQPTAVAQPNQGAPASTAFLMT